MALGPPSLRSIAGCATRPRRKCAGQGRSPAMVAVLTNGSAVRSPTAASTTALSPVTSHALNWRPRITAPTKPSNRSSIYLPPDLRSESTFVQLVVSKICPGRI